MAAVAGSGQLEVRTWADAYLRGGRFDRSAQRAYTRKTIAEGPELGFAWTRLIGSTEWAVEAETVHDLLFYEARIDEDLRMLPGTTVCTYDINHHSTRTIADALSVHPVALVGGVLRMPHGPARASARDRLVTAASRLFYQNGILPTGVDSVISAAGVAKATFYRHFPSKDDLVVAWLRDPRARWFDRVRAQAEAEVHRADGGDPEVLRCARRLARDRGLPGLSVPEYDRRDHGSVAPRSARERGIPAGDRGRPGHDGRVGTLSRIPGCWPPSCRHSWLARSRWPLRVAAATLSRPRERPRCASSTRPRAAESSGQSTLRGAHRRPPPPREREPHGHHSPSAPCANWPRCRLRVR